MNIQPYKAKTLVRTSSQTESHIHLNPYQGCYHNCAYCFGKSEEYYMHQDYSGRIRVKINAPELLENYLKKKGFIPYNRDRTSTLIDYIPYSSSGIRSNLPPKFVISMFGNVCDVYQPAEKKVEITKKLLQIAYDFGFPIRILTKSNLVLRDIDLLKKIHQDSYARIAITITLYDEEKQKIFEPNASSTSERFDTVKTLRENGISSGIYITPVIPFIGDSDDNLTQIINKAKEVNAEFIISGGLSLSPGRNKQEFMGVIKTHFPEYLERFKLLYENNNKYGQPNPKIAESFNLKDPIKKGYEICKKYNMFFYEPRIIPEGQIKTNLLIATALYRIAFLQDKIYHSEENIIKEYHQAANFCESISQDMSSIPNEEIQSLPFSSIIIDIISEIINSNNCQYLLSKNEWKNLIATKK
ncbi:MAG: radical SAM protein [Candidatus Thorarchaeota archaeon]